MMRLRRDAVQDEIRRPAQYGGNQGMHRLIDATTFSSLCRLDRVGKGEEQSDGSEGEGVGGNRISFATQGP